MQRLNMFYDHCCDGPSIHTHTYIHMYIRLHIGACVSGMLHNMCIQCITIANTWYCGRASPG